MNKIHNYLVLSFLIGLILFIVGLIIGIKYYKLFHVFKVLTTIGTILICGSGILSAIYPLKKE